MGKFKDVIKGKIPVLIDFYADWCGPCKIQSPILNELKNEMGDQIRVVKIDVDKNRKISQKLAIRGIPTLMLFANGKQLWRHSGLVTKDQLKSVIRQHHAQNA